MKKNLSEKSFVAVIWNALGYFSTHVTSAVIGIVLARLLLPSDYGLISIAVVFSVISNVFVDGGLGSALIRKKEVSKADLSTVFYFNIIIAVFFYSLIYILSPKVSDFFELPQLSIIIRVLSLNIIINAFGAIQNVLLVKKLNYRTQSYIRIISIIISGAIGIYMAFSGYGVWAIVIQSVSQQSIWLVLIWSKSIWKPSFIFSQESIRELFSFGSKLMISNFLYQTLAQVYPVVIGKLFPIAQLGYYSRAENYQKMTGRTLTKIVADVSFPALSKIQDDDARLKEGYVRIIRLIMFINIPLMIGLVLIADSLIITLLTEKWRPVIPYFQWLCIAGLFHPSIVIIMNVFNVKGRSDLYLYIVLIKETINLLAIIIGYNWGVIGLVVGQVVVALITFLLCGFMAGREIKYSVIQQIKDISIFFFMSIVIFAFGWLIGNLLEHTLVRLITQTAIFIVLYAILAYVFKIKQLNELTSMFKKLL